jgi:NADP-dependent 3-hydroxy acid dehydrogenase YdfG
MTRVMQTNFVGVLNVTNAVLPHMRNRREGLIVCIGSRSAFRNQMTVSYIHVLFVAFSSHTLILTT